MSLQNGRIVPLEVLNTDSLHLTDVEHQIGDPVWLHVVESDEVSQIAATVVGVSIAPLGETTYDLAFQVSTKHAVRVPGFRGFITRPGEYMYSEADTTSVAPKPSLQIVPKE